MSLFAAVESVGKEVLVILDNEVIGKGRTQIGRDDWVGVQFTEGRIIEMVKNLKLVKAIGMKHSYFRYYSNFGHFNEINCEDDHEAAQAILGKTMIVDEFNFKFGACPEHFKNVEGYRSALNDLKD